MLPFQGLNCHLGVSVCSHRRCLGGLGGTESCAEWSAFPLTSTSHTVSGLQIFLLIKQGSLQETFGGVCSSTRNGRARVCNRREAWDGAGTEMERGKQTESTFPFCKHRPLSQTPACPENRRPGQCGIRGCAAFERTALFDLYKLTTRNNRIQ